MKRIFTTLILLGALFGASAQSADSLSILMGKTQGAMLNDQLQRMAMPDNFKEQLVEGLATVMMADTTNLGYIEGLQMGLQMLREFTNISRLGAPIDRAEFVRHLRQALLSAPMSKDELRATTNRLNQILEPYRQRATQMQQQQSEAQALERQATAEANQAAGKAFIDSLVAANDGVKRLPSGLAYKVVAKGKGGRPKQSQTVDVRYTGTLIDGTVFDTSGDETREFPLGGVIKGFSEGIGLMNKGAKYILYIPGALAYGPQGVGEMIGPDATLVFEVELVDFH